MPNDCAKRLNKRTAWILGMMASLLQFCVRTLIKPEQNHSTQSQLEWKCSSEFVSGWSIVPFNQRFVHSAIVRRLCWTGNCWLLRSGSPI